MSAGFLSDSRGNGSSQRLSNFLVTVTILACIVYVVWCDKALPHIEIEYVALLLGTGAIVAFQKFKSEKTDPVPPPVEQTKPEVTP